MKTDSGRWLFPGGSRCGGRESGRQGKGPKAPPFDYAPLDFAPFGCAQGEQGSQGERGGRCWQDSWQAGSAPAARIAAGPGDGARGPGVLYFQCPGAGIGR